MLEAEYPGRADIVRDSSRESRKKMKIARLIAAFAVALMADIVINRIFHFAHPFFDPFLILTVAYATASKPLGSIFIGAAAGIVQDTWGGSIFGLNGFKKTLIAYLIAVLASIFDLTGVPARLIVLCAATILDSLVEAGLMIVVGRGASPAVFTAMGIKILGNALFGIITFAVIARISRKKYSEAL